MRCDDLTRGLANPTGALASARIAEHLASCPACAERSRQSGRLDRIWEATRPSEPSMDALDALWARASAELDGISEKAPATLKFARPSGRRRWAMAGFVAANAAAVLVGAVILLDRRDGAGPGPDDLALKSLARVELKAPKVLDLKVEPNVVMVVRIGEANGVNVDQDDMSSQFDSPTIPDGSPKDLFDAVETMAPSSGVLASK